MSRLGRSFPQQTYWRRQNSPPPMYSNVILVVLSIVSNTVVTVVKQAGLIKLIAASTQPSLGKLDSHGILVGVASGTTLTKTIGKIFSLVDSVLVSIQNQIGKVFQIVVVSSAVTSKQDDKGILILSASGISPIKFIGKSINVVVVTVTTLAVAKIKILLFNISVVIARITTLTDLVWNTNGFESGSSLATYFSSTSGSTIAVSSTQFNAGGNSLNINPSSGNACYGLKSVTAKSVVVVRFYIFFSSLPSQGIELFTVNPGSGSAARFGIDNTTGKFGTIFGTSQTFQNLSIVPSIGVWYLVDLKVDFSNNPSTFDYQINQVAYTQNTVAQAATTAGDMYTGHPTGFVSSFNAYYDDMIATNNPAEYPIGSGVSKQISLIKIVEKILTSIDGENISLQNLMGHGISVVSPTSTAINKGIETIKNIVGPTTTTLLKKILKTFSIVVNTITTINVQKLSGGNFMTISISVNTLASLQKGIFKNTIPGVTTNPSLQNQADKGLSAVLVTTSTLTKRVSKFVSLVVTTILSINKQDDKGLSIVDGSSISLQKTIGKIESILSPTLVSIRKAIGAIKNIVDPTTVSTGKQGDKNVLAPVVTSVFFDHPLIQKGINIVVTTTTTLNKFIFKSLSIMVVTVTTAFKIKATFFTFLISQGSTTNISKADLKNIIPSVGSSPSLQNQMDKGLSIIITTTTTVRKLIQKAFSSSITTITSLLKQADKFFIVTDGTQAVLSKQGDRGINISQGDFISPIKYIGKNITRITVVTTTTLSVIKARFITLLVSVATSVSLGKSMGLHDVVGVTASIVDNKFIGKSINAIQDSVQIIRNGVDLHIISVQIGSNVKLVRFISKVILLADQTNVLLNNGVRATRNISVVSSVSDIKYISKLIRAIQDSTVVMMTDIGMHLRTLSAIVTTSPVLSKRIFKNISPLSVLNVSPGKFVFTAINTLSSVIVTAIVTPGHGRLLFINLNVTQSILTTLTPRASIFALVAMGYRLIGFVFVPQIYRTGNRLAGSVTNTPETHPITTPSSDGNIDSHVY